MYLYKGYNESTEPKDAVLTLLNLLLNCDVKVFQFNNVKTTWRFKSC